MNRRSTDKSRIPAALVHILRAKGPRHWPAGNPFVQTADGVLLHELEPQWQDDGDPAVKRIIEGDKAILTERARLGYVEPWDKPGYGTMASYLDGSE